MRFGLPGLDRTRSTTSQRLSDLGYTAVGFAALAATQANAARLDANARHAEQVEEARIAALALLERVEHVRQRTEQALDPWVERATYRLPASLQGALEDYRALGRELAARLNRSTARLVELVAAVPVSHDALRRPPAAP